MRFDRLLHTVITFLGMLSNSHAIVIETRVTREMVPQVASSVNVLAEKKDDGIHFTVTVNKPPGPSSFFDARIAV